MVSRQTVVSCGCLSDRRVAMARVQQVDLEKRVSWVRVIAREISVLYHRGSGRVSEGAVERSGTKIP